MYAYCKALSFTRRMKKHKWIWVSKVCLIVCNPQDHAISPQLKLEKAPIVGQPQIRKSFKDDPLCNGASTDFLTPSFHLHTCHQFTCEVNILGKFVYFESSFLNIVNFAQLKHHIYGEFYSI